MKLRNTLRNPARLILILAALIVLTAIVISWDTDNFTQQTAVGQTNDTLDNTSADFQYLERANRAFINLVKQTRPAVVQIRTQTKPSLNRRQRNFFGDDDIYRFFFGPDESEPETLRGLGSGVIVGADGYILTNNHVIDGVDHITVVLANGPRVSSRISWE